MTVKTVHFSHICPTQPYVEHICYICETRFFWALFVFLKFLKKI